MTEIEKTEPTPEQVEEFKQEVADKVNEETAADIVQVIYLCRHKKTGNYFYTMLEDGKKPWQSLLHETFTGVKNALRKALK